MNTWPACFFSPSLPVGANDGQSLTWFQKHWAPLSPRPFTSVTAFEMNSVFDPVLKTLLARWNGDLVTAAAWTSDGFMQANLQLPGSRVGSKGGVFYNMTSSALEVGGVPLNRKANHQRGRGEARSRVPTVDVARWLGERYCREDQVDLKMDIEGAEFEVLEHLLRSGRALLVDTLAVEWHISKRAQGGARAALQLRQAAILKGLARANVKIVDWEGLVRGRNRLTSARAAKS